MTNREPPLTAREIDIAKLYNRWYGRRKAFLMENDKPRGNEFSRKNLEDLVDLFLQQAPAILLAPAQLAHIVRRYRGHKAANTVAKKKRIKLRDENREKRLADEAAKRKKREEAARAKEEIRSRQGILTGFIFD